VTVHSRAHSERLQFLVDHNYSFDASDRFIPSEQDLRRTGNRASHELKRREAKCDRKISTLITKMKRSHEQMTFYQNMAENPLTKIQNTIVQQNDLLRIL